MAAKVEHAATARDAARKTLPARWMGFFVRAGTVGDRTAWCGPPTDEVCVFLLGMPWAADGRQSTVGRVGRTCHTSRANPHSGETLR